MKKVAISTDSVADLGEELVQKNGIIVFPLIINMGSESMHDCADMPAKVFKYVKDTGKLPKTAARSVEDYLEFFKAAKPEGGELVHFNISNKLSASNSMAKAAAEQIQGVYIVDTLSLSTGSGLSVLYGAELAKEGKLSGKEIADICQERAKHVQASFFLDSLEFLHKGGRCSGLKLFITSILRIKPAIVLKDGAMGPGKKYRGKFEVLIDKYVDDILDEFNTPHLKHIFITYTTADDEIVKRVKEKVLARHPFENVHITRAGGTITCHCGHNTLGILYYNDGEQKS